MPTQWDELRRVVDPLELEEVFGFRYRIYVEEQHRHQQDANHGRRCLRDKLDDFGINIAAFRNGAIVGTVRVNFPRIGDIGYYETLYNMTDSGADHPARTSIVTRLMIDPALRNGTLAVRLAAACYKVGLDHGVRWCYIDCRENHIEFFSGLGFKVKNESILHPEFGPATLMLLDCLDIDSLDKCKSPFRKLYRDHFTQLSSTTT